jgi:hypothetical protein
MLARCGFARPAGFLPPDGEGVLVDSDVMAVVNYVRRLVARLKMSARCDGSWCALLLVYLRLTSEVVYRVKFRLGVAIVVKDQRLLSLLASFLGELPDRAGGGEGQ